MKTLYVWLGFTISAIILMIAYRVILQSDDFSSGLIIGVMIGIPMMVIGFGGAILVIAVVLKKERKQSGPVYPPYQVNLPPTSYGPVMSQNLLPPPADLDFPESVGQGAKYEEW